MGDGWGPAGSGGDQKWGRRWVGARWGPEWHRSVRKHSDATPDTQQRCTGNVALPAFLLPSCRRRQKWRGRGPAQLSSVSLFASLFISQCPSPAQPVQREPFAKRKPSRVSCTKSAQHTALPALLKTLISVAPLIHICKCTVSLLSARAQRPSPHAMA